MSSFNYTTCDDDVTCKRVGSGGGGGGCVGGGVGWGGGGGDSKELNEINEN